MKTKHKFLLTIAVLALAWLPQQAFAIQPVQQVGYRTGAVTGHVCSTGTVSQLNLTPPPTLSAAEIEQIAGWRVQNQSSTFDVHIGSMNVSVPADGILATRGEKLGPGDSAPYHFGRRLHRREFPVITLGCKVPDTGTAAADQVTLTVYWFLY